MAAPVVSGVAAFILSYFPDLSPQQLKQIIEKSATRQVVKVTNPGTEEMVTLEDISVTGGVINAYEATKLAATISGNKTATPKAPVKPTTTVKKMKKA